VTTAGSAQEALAHIETLIPDVLLSDIGVPEEAGYSLIRMVRALGRERCGHVPAATLTAYTRAEDRDRVFDAGYQLFVPKPVEPAELIDAVARLIGR
jgi:CheY-like chemotaxis protein